MGRQVKYKILYIGMVFSSLSSQLYTAPVIEDIVSRGDRNLKIILSIYEKYSFMPAKRAYFNMINEDWIRGKVLHSHANPEERKQKLDKVLKSYNLTNDVLKDISIDLSSLSEIVMDDFTQKIIDSKNMKSENLHNKSYNRYVVSRNEFSRAERGFKQGLYYYSARLYDHGLTLMKTVYHDNGWVFPKSKPNNEIKNQSLSMKAQNLP